MLRSASGYPAALGDLSDAPSRLGIAGQLPSLAHAVSIVGTRVADDEALEFTFDLARDLAQAGRAVVSGGAVGIDRAAHEGALAAGGSTVVVLPIGFDQPYPPANFDLFERVLESGCLLTEVESGATMQKGRFLARNRLVAALGASTIVVQAPARSGALSTARHARRLGRKVFAVPASPWDPRGSGNLALLRGGARICVRAGDVLSGSASPTLPKSPIDGDKSQKNNDSKHLSDTEQQILISLGGRARHPEELCQRTGIPALEVQRSIVTLLVRGLIEERPGGRFKSCARPAESY